MMDVEWLEPWWCTEEQDDRFHQTFARQLEREVGPQHPLYGIPARVVARHGGCDDTLFELLDSSGRFALVHLTWSQSPEPMPWPSTAIYSSLQEFVETRMREDHEEYNV